MQSSTADTSFFKSFYSDVVGPEKAVVTWKTGVYRVVSASAQFFADIALSPFEAVKVRTHAGRHAAVCHGDVRRNLKDCRKVRDSRVCLLLMVHALKRE